MAPAVASQRQRHEIAQPKRRGRPKQPLVTGYVIGDDSTMSKPKGKKMQGLGQHHSTTQDKRIVGHSLVLGLYVRMAATLSIGTAAVSAGKGVPEGRDRFPEQD